MVKENGKTTESETEGDKIVLEVPTPEPSEIPDDQENEDAEFARLAERISALDDKITDGLKGAHEWTTETITSLKQEVADLKATLEQAAKNLPSQVTELREELTRLSQELRQAVTERVQATEIENQPVQMSPPEVPPDPNQSSAEEGAHPVPQQSQKPRTKRII